MSLSFPNITQFASIVGRTPGPQPTPSSAYLVWLELNSLVAGGCRGTRADQGVRTTISARFSALGLLSDLAHECVRHIQGDFLDE
jgi:hypothetical protein